MDFKYKFKLKFRAWNRARINGTRNLILKIIIFLFDSKRNKVEGLNEEAPILVLRSDGKIGDSIIATGFFRELRKYAPKSRIVVIGSPQILSIYENSEYIDEFHIIKKGALSTLKTYLKVRGTHYRFFVNTTDELKPDAAFLQGQIKAEKKLVFGKKKLCSTTHPISYREGQGHFTMLYLNTLQEMFSRQDFDLSYELKVSEEVLEKVKSLMDSQVEKGKRIIAFNSFAGNKLRSFSAETSLKIVESLLKDSRNVVLSIGAPKDIKKILSWRKKLPHERWIVMEELETLEECFAQVQCSDLLISPDTSLVHAACALNKKVVGIYRQRREFQNSVKWGPIMKDVSLYRVIHAYSDHVLYWDVNLVKINEVEEAVKELMF